MQFLIGKTQQKKTTAASKSIEHQSVWQKAVLNIDFSVERANFIRQLFLISEKKGTSWKGRKKESVGHLFLHILLSSFCQTTQNPTKTRQNGFVILIWQQRSPPLTSSIEVLSFRFLFYFFCLANQADCCLLRVNTSRQRQTYRGKTYRKLIEITNVCRSETREVCVSKSESCKLKTMDFDFN